ncbi:hypothetical protein ABWK22_01965 [Gottfriedia acidiceleris]|uniref:hypothetical protein n=1 Tax=Gottfriedia acidiceleris TaxID=371036 RepID=UPI00339133D5
MFPFLVATLAEYTDPTGVMIHPDGEPGGEGWTEFKDSKEVVLGTYMAKDEQEAIEAASIEHELSTDVLTVYQLAFL